MDGLLPGNPGSPDGPGPPNPGSPGAETHQTQLNANKTFVCFIGNSGLHLSHTDRALL